MEQRRTVPLASHLQSALRLTHELSHPNAYLYWQPNQNRNTDFNIEALKTVLPYVLNVHVFAWNVIDKKIIRYPLCDYAEAWKKYLDIPSTSDRSHNLLIEFVKEDSDDSFIADSATLNAWLK